MPTWKKGTDVTVFTLGGTAMIGVLHDCDIEMKVGSENAATIGQISENPQPVSRARRITGTAGVDSAVKLAAAIEGNNPSVSFTVNTGSAIYSGNALLTQVTHRNGRGKLQEETFEMLVQGDWTVT